MLLDSIISGECYWATISAVGLGYRPSNPIAIGPAGLGLVFFRRESIACGQFCPEPARRSVASSRPTGLIVSSRSRPAAAPPYWLQSKHQGNQQQKSSVSLYTAFFFLLALLDTDLLIYRAGQNSASRCLQQQNCLLYRAAAGQKPRIPFFRV